MKPFLILLIICGCSISMSAQNSVQEYTLVVKEKQADKDNGKLLLSMKIDVSNIDIIIGKTKSTNFQNEKYKKGMSFKYYINGA